MSVKKGVITIMDSEKNFASMRFEGVADLTALTTLETAVLVLTDGNAKRRAIVEADILSPATPASGHVDKKGVVTTQDSDGHIHRWSIPSFSGTEIKTKDGYRMDDTELATIVAAIATATGMTLTALESPVIQSS